MSKKHKVYVYGTLRPNKGDTVLVPGYLYDLGWYPGIKLVYEAGENTSKVVAEVLEVDEDELMSLDRYEGFSPDNPSTSLYLRVPYADGWIYEYNDSMEGYPQVEGGDWVKASHNNKYGVTV